ncbi:MULTISPECIES: dipeptidyl-peptidase 5 [Streptosporangium]|uniref:Dipeptidyl aminopeptidase/acylaminoacyl peptidase n=1 Tax=Streptosporangium brasiliense TaxID=47480 RepID=A0ABT9QYP1_9ACTN|nr:prolyl oligopeptidase family serine peptidase [Streptosporangium brasiliense]MDP9862088.1 dipeptidyl aminopeptidase/acylaminoacyl peptidase [Streptosporangium brasiliense]
MLNDSPIRPIDVARVDDRPLWVEILGEEVWWDEPRPHEGGRRCVVRRGPDGVPRDAIPQGWNSRNRLIEYGGRSWRPLPDGRVVFTNWADQRIYLYGGRPGPAAGTGGPTAPHGDDRPLPLTPDDGARYGDLYLPPGREEVWAVRETHPAAPETGAAGTGAAESPEDGAGPGRRPLPRRDLVAVPLDGGPVRVIATAQHFLTNPRLSPDGTHVAWIGWDHPAMPWDGTELCVAPLDAAGAAGPYRVVAGGPQESVIQAEWRDDGALYALTDPDGWWNLHLVPLDGSGARNLAPLQEDCGDAVWRLGNTWFALAGDRIVLVHGTPDLRRLAVLDPATGEMTDLEAPPTYWNPTVSTGGDLVAGVAASPYTPFEVVTVDLRTGAHAVLSPEKDLPDRDALPEPEAVTFDGVHAHLYPPRGVTGPAPYVIFVHGGPTSASTMVLDVEIAYFTSRGIGVADVNYGGSTGYGRAYRERLRHQWGVVDVRDCETVARGLIDAGRAHPSKVAIRGGSAGGWTSVAALVHSKVFRGAVAHYAITDPEGWAAETHDFESRYLDGLIGPLPETRQRYLDRSPTLHAADASGPALLMHGLEDAIVDPVQAERFADALEREGTPWAYLTFPGEQHGWRREETIVAALEAELAFYGLIFGFPTPEVPPLTLRGMH